jgi:riboflavin synthase
VEETGSVVRITDANEGRKRLIVRAAVIMDDLAIDHSVSVNGVCLTVTERTDDTFSVDVIAETLRKTTIGDLTEGARVNLERAVRVSDRLGGHIVQGHVDAVGTVDVVDGNDIWIRFDPSYRRWLIPVGSICVNGVSLTVADLEADRFKVSVIPHTWNVTTIGDLRAGSPVNLEFDVLAKYAENIIRYGTP